MIKVAACQYHIDLLPNWEAYADHLTALCEEAAGQGADLLLLPEYAGLVLTGLLPEATRGDLHGSIAGIQPLLPRWLGVRRSLRFVPAPTGARMAPILPRARRSRRLIKCLYNR